ncbi:MULTISPECIES: ribokinase [unclassified Staphylococcus]|uniref:ribokinase n=1 Tax=unclassified Staphylococcus TaxID=91994 RepID=UPI0021D38A92|nr:MULTISPECIES: ribokinase [unclassified Staphylococcus]UXR77901.1 ribokinase [Staphylococcus sp. IVB6227]UXR82062.1 ribokinase [Staphylococcus sp. IVB6214]
MTHKIIVIGSASMDLTVQTQVIPDQGETVLGETLYMAPGGKGANQAVAAARLKRDRDVYIVGAVGDDAFGQTILNNFRQHSVNVDYMQIIEGEHSGTAHITLYEQDNRIIVVPAANNKMIPEVVLPILQQFEKGDIIVMQQEIPAETVEAVIDEAARLGLQVILNPAPYRAIDIHLLNKVTYLTPNASECQQLFGASIDDALAQYPNQLIVTLGAEGATYFDQTRQMVPAYPCDVIDTTGAGDTFNGTLAVALSEGQSLETAIQFANMASSFAVTALGAQGGIPTREAVDAALNK